MTQSGITQRTKWMQKFSDYQQKFIAARDAFNEAAAPPAHTMDGMPHGSAKSDPVASRPSGTIKPTAITSTPKMQWPLPKISASVPCRT